MAAVPGRGGGRAVANAADVAQLRPLAAARDLRAQPGHPEVQRRRRNAILVRGEIGEHRSVRLTWLPERRYAHGVRLADGSWVVNVHTSTHGEEGRARRGHAARARGGPRVGRRRAAAVRRRREHPRQAGAARARPARRQPRRPPLQRGPPGAPGRGARARRRCPTTRRCASASDPEPAQHQQRALARPARASAARRASSRRRRRRRTRARGEAAVRELGVDDRVHVELAAGGSDPAELAVVRCRGAGTARTRTRRRDAGAGRVHPRVGHRLPQLPGVARAPRGPISGSGVSGSS